MLREAARGAPQGSATLCMAPQGSAKLRDKLRETAPSYLRPPRGCGRLPEAARGSARLCEAPRGSAALCDAPRRSAEPRGGLGEGGMLNERLRDHALRSHTHTRTASPHEGVPSALRDDGHAVLRRPIPEGPLVADAVEPLRADQRRRLGRPGLSDPRSVTRASPHPRPILLTPTRGQSCHDDGHPHTLFELIRALPALSPLRLQAYPAPHNGRTRRRHAPRCLPHRTDATTHSWRLGPLPKAPWVPQCPSCLRGPVADATVRRHLCHAKARTECVAVQRHRRDSHTWRSRSLPS